MIVSVNPATGAELARFEAHDSAAVESALAAAAKAQSQWRLVPVTARVDLLRRMAQALRADKARLAQLVSIEMGKPLAEAASEVEKCAWNCEFYAEQAPGFMADQTVVSNASESAVVFEPLGVILAIMPWNYPMWQFFRFAAPALAAGNGIILKHANNVPQCALAIEDVMKAAQCPEGLFKALLIEPDLVEGMINDRRIAAVTLTGSTQVGRIVASQAGKALKKQVLELGGSDPFIVLADADLEKAAEVAVRARFVNVGQSCVAAKRFLVVESVADRFVELFVARAQNLKVGDPLESGVTIGPMARANLRNELHGQVERTLAAGGTLKLGGQPLPGPGYFYPPTVIDNVTPAMPSFREETFGPVASIIRVRDEEEAIALANDTEFGLGAVIWSSNIARAKQLARRIDSGIVYINGMVGSDPRLPFGGIKNSGYGRELGDFGLKEFVNVKTVWVGPIKTG